VKLLDVIAGYYLSGVLGWLFLVFVLISEGFILSKRLSGRKKEKKYYFVATCSNLVTTILGYLLLDDEKKGGHLLTWIPMDEYKGHLEPVRSILFFVACFLASVFIETIINCIMLRNLHPVKAIWTATLTANIFTYLIAVIVFFVYFLWIK
jgi:hypothetical protein